MFWLCPSSRYTMVKIYLKKILAVFKIFLKSKSMGRKRETDKEKNR
jgi:hypothetical protein